MCLYKEISFVAEYVNMYTVPLQMIYCVYRQIDDFNINSVVFSNIYYDKKKKKKKKKKNKKKKKEVYLELSIHILSL